MFTTTLFRFFDNKDTFHYLSRHKIMRYISIYRFFFLFFTCFSSITMKRVPSVGSQSAFSSTNVYLCSACTPKILIPTGHTKSKWDKEKQHVTRLTSLCKYIAGTGIPRQKKDKT